MATGNCIFVLSCFIVYSLLSLRVSEGQLVPAIFVFGDSLVDVGNNNHLRVSIAKANFPHNGIDFPTKKPTGRFCNGKNAADFFAQKLGLQSAPPYLSLKVKNVSSLMTGVSFASGGAGILNNSDQALAQSIPLTKQVSYYEMVHQALSQNLSASQNYFSKSIFVIVIGSNDLFDYFSTSRLQSKYTPQQYMDLMASRLKLLITRMYNTGGRKYVVGGLGPIGCTPGERVKNETEECNVRMNSMAKLYNEHLKSMLRQLKSELSGFSFSFLNIYDALDSLVLQPSTYGFAEVKSACCGLGKLKAKVPCIPVSTYCSNRRDHVFWDLYHPTEAAANILVDNFYDGPSEYTFPINVGQLISM